MPKARPKVGSIVEITFDDHSEGGDDAMRCTVWGKITNVTKRAYTVTTWYTSEDDDEHNNPRYHILKAAIVDLKTLTPR